MFPNIEAERARNKMSQQYLADYLGISTRTLTNWLSGRNEIPCSAIVKMSKLWGKPTDYLLGSTDTGQPDQAS